MFIRSKKPLLGPEKQKEREPMILNNVKILSRCPKKLMEFLHMGNLDQRSKQ